MITPPLPDLLTKLQLDFLQTVTPPALDSARHTTIPAAITIAQAIYESSTGAGWGTSVLFTEANNPFGIRYAHTQGVADYREFDVPTWEMINGKIEHMMGRFQSFPDMQTAFDRHAMLLLRSRCVVMAIPSGVEAVAVALGPWTDADRAELAARRFPAHANYSTNPGYAARLMYAIGYYHLDSLEALQGYAQGRDLGFGARDTGNGAAEATLVTPNAPARSDAVVSASRVPNPESPAPSPEARMYCDPEIGQ